jgi:hypothetical protein
MKERGLLTTSEYGRDELDDLFRSQSQREEERSEKLSSRSDTPLWWQMSKPPPAGEPFW